MLLNITQYLKSLPESKGETFIPAKQLLIQIIDLMGKFKKSKMTDIGFFHYIKNYYNKKHSQSFDRKMRSFLKSLVKFGKEGSQVGWFAKVIENNTEYLITSALVRAINLMRKKYQDLNSKHDDTFKRVKMNIQDILKILKRIFKPKIKGYLELNGVNLQTRVRDYVIEIQPSVIMETSGLGFLEIVRREAYLVMHKIEEQMALSANTEDLFRQKEDDGEKDIQKMQEDFYDMNDLMGMQYHHLPEGYVKNVKKYQMYQKMGDERAEPRLREGGEQYEPEGTGAVEDIEELSFDDIYETIYDKQKDRDFLELIKNLQKMEAREQGLDNDLEEIPTFQTSVDDLLHQIVKIMQQRYEKLAFMKHMIHKMQNHEESKGEQTMVDEAFLEEFNSMEHFYSHFHQDLNALLFGAVKTDRHAVNEYFMSSNASKFNRSEPYDYENPPNPIKEGEEDGEEEEYYETDYDDESYRDRHERQGDRRSRDNSTSKMGDQEFLDYDRAMRQSSTTRHKERLRSRRRRNENNSRVRDTMVENYGRDDENRSRRSKEIARSPRRGSLESQSSNVQENLGRLAEYVKSAEFKHRKDLENEEEFSDEDEIVFRNTKQRQEEEYEEEQAEEEYEEEEQESQEHLQRSPISPSEGEEEYESISYDHYPEMSKKRIGDSDYNQSSVRGGNPHIVNNFRTGTRLRWKSCRRGFEL